MEFRPVRKSARLQLKNCAEGSPEVVFDMSLDAMMSDDDAAECVKLCSRINRVNKFSGDRLPLHFTGIRPDGVVKTHLMRNGYLKWPVRTSTEHFMKLFDPEKLIYLTNESDNVIYALEREHVYVLGGLVDHNKHGKHFLRLAEEFDIQHARLCLLELVVDNRRTVVRIDHVFDMLLDFHAGKTVKQSLMKLQPSINYATGAPKVEVTHNAPIVKIPMQPRKKQREMIYAPVSPEVVVDLSLNSMLTEDEATECIKQLACIDKVNRGAKLSIPLHVVGIGSGGSLRSRILQNRNYLQWAVRYSTEHFMELFEPEKFIYLTNESDNEVNTLERNHFYVIGGLTDHIRHGKHFLNLAKEFGIRHARLPLGDHLNVNSETVLALNQVFEMLLNVNAGKDWPQTLLTVLPVASVKQERNN